jgi:hypothetical protein
MRLLKGFSDAGEIEGEGTPEERKAVQERQRGEKLQRDQRERIAMNGRCIARADLTDGPLGLLEDITDGAFYRVSNGEHTSEDTFAAFTTAANGDIVFLEAPASGPRSRAELDQARADREARRAAPRPRPAWMNQ